MLHVPVVCETKTEIVIIAGPSGIDCRLQYILAARLQDRGASKRSGRRLSGVRFDAIAVRCEHMLAAASISASGNKSNHTHHAEYDECAAPAAEHACINISGTASSTAHANHYDCRQHNHQQCAAEGWLWWIGMQQKKLLLQSGATEKFAAPSGATKESVAPQ